MKSADFAKSGSLFQSFLKSVTVIEPEPIFRVPRLVKTNHMPVRFLIYVAMTALTRLMIADIQHNHTPDDGIILVSVALLLLALAILVVRFASARFPSAKSDGAAARRVASEDAEGEA
ncbi:phosphate-starvation-inducible PsiE family protein [Pseudomonas aeruginosa]|uniref:phosphate-starvation-inducible PsiE family protein n=1 Tax=Pseudomonas aeruginosa TaxID=287 RepID=UPI0039170785